MPRKYRHVKEYENEILELREKGLTRQEIAGKFGMTKEQIKGFIRRYNRNQEKNRGWYIFKEERQTAKGLCCNGAG